MSSPTNNAPLRRGRSAAATRDNSPLPRENPTFENVPPAQSADHPPPPAAPPVPAPSASLTGDQLTLLLQQVATSNRPRYQIERRAIPLLPSQPGSWTLEALADHLNSQRQYVNAVYRELGPDDGSRLNAWVEQGHWREFVPESAAAAGLAIDRALHTAANAHTATGVRRPAGACYLDALIQVYVPGAPGQAGVAVMNHVENLSPEPNLLGFLHQWRTLTRMLPFLGTDVSDTFRRDWLLRKLPPQMRGQLNARLMEERTRGNEPTFNRTFDLAVELAPWSSPLPSSAPSPPRRAGVTPTSTSTRTRRTWSAPSSTTPRAGVARRSGVAPITATPGRDGAAREATKVVPRPGSSRSCRGA